jgi:hypothetical protein
MTLADARAQSPLPPATRHPAATRPSPAEAAAAAEQADRLRALWVRAREEARAARAGAAAFSRVADLAASFSAMALRIGERQKARAVVGDALSTLRAAAVADRGDASRHLALARTLELAAAVEAGAGDARASFDALRAAIATLAPFAPRLRDRSADPFLRMAIAAGLCRPIAGAAAMIDDAPQRRLALEQLWDECAGWAAAATGAADHATAVEHAVLAAFELAAAETAESASRCLERCEDLRPHLDALRDARGDDAVHRGHRAAFCRLSADAWRRLGDREEAARCLAEAEEHLRAAAGLPDADLRAIAAQREAMARDRAR